MLLPLQTRFEALEARRLALTGTLGALPPEQLAFRPRSNAWSLADIAQHLSLVDARTTRVLTERRVTGITRRRWRDRLVFAPGLDLYFATRWRAKMPVKGVAPDPAVPLEQTAERWAATRAQLAAYLDSLDDAGARAIVYRHPIAGYMDIFETIRFLTRHHDHHRYQLCRIHGAKAFPVSAPAARGTA